MLPRRSLLLAPLLGLAACGGHAYKEWIDHDTEPVVFAAAGPLPGLRLASPVVLGDVHAGPGVSSRAGDLGTGPDSIPVAFSEETRPAEVLRGDLQRMLAAASEAAPGAVGRRLDVTLVQAYVRRDDHVLRRSEMKGRVVLEATLVDLVSGRHSWSYEAVGEHAARPAYITSEAVAEALNGAYAEALAQLATALR